MKRTEIILQNQPNLKSVDFNQEKDSTNMALNTFLTGW